MKGDENDGNRKTCVRTTLEAIYACAHFLAPFIPTGADKIFKKLNQAPVCITELKASLTNLKVGNKVSVGEVLFTKIVTDEERSAEEAKKKKAEEVRLERLLSTNGHYENNQFSKFH
jgi:methionyl-tRNA synthetase